MASESFLQQRIILYRTFTTRTSSSNASVNADPTCTRKGKLWVETSAVGSQVRDPIRRNESAKAQKVVKPKGVITAGGGTKRPRRGDVIVSEIKRQSANEQACLIIAKVDDEILTSRYKWLKGEAANGRGRVCLSRAVNMASEPYGEQARVLVRDAVRQEVSKEMKDAHAMIITFNDARHTKFTDVKRVIKAVRERFCRDG